MDTVTGLDLTRAMLASNQYPVVCRYLREEWLACLTEFQGNENVFFAIGLKSEDINEIAKVALSEDAPVVFSEALDVAHGDSEHAIEVIAKLRELPYIGNIMSGSVCTAQGAIRNIEAGATHIRVGVGPGAACTTRLMTGCGMPQLSAVYNINKALKDYEIHLPKGEWPETIQVRSQITIIADGGIRYPGDAVKYLAAGADGVMLGRRFSECHESAGWQNGIKQYRGQASASFQQAQFGKENACPEGATGNSFRPSKGCKEIIQEFEGGLASAISYLGLISTTQLRPENVNFIRVTPSGYTEGTPHGV